MSLLFALLVAVHRVLLVSPRGDDEDAERTHRIRAELEAASVEVLDLGLTEPVAEVTPERLAGFARAHEAERVVVLHPGRSYAVVWTMDDDTLEERAVVVGDRVAEGKGDPVFALRVAEVVDATFIEVEPEPPPAPKPPPKKEPPPVKRKDPVPPRWGTRVGLHAVGSNGDLGFMLGPAIGAIVGLGPRRRFALDFDAMATGLGGKVRGEAGEATVGFAAIRGVAAFWPTPLSRLSPGFGAGWGMLIAWTRGRARPPFEDQRDATVVNTPVGAVDLAISITERLRVRFSFRIGAALPVVRVASGAGSKRTAQPIADGGLALELVGPSR